MKFNVRYTETIVHKYTIEAESFDKVHEEWNRLVEDHKIDFSGGEVIDTETEVRLVEGWYLFNERNMYFDGDYVYIDGHSDSFKNFKLMCEIMGIKLDGTDQRFVQLNPEDFTIEYCPFCDSEQVIYAKGITACPDCGKPLAPCSMCYDCDYNTCPYGCDGSSNDEFKTITNPVVTPEMADYMYGKI